MAPYRGDNVRYHLSDFRRGATRQLWEPNGRIEKFNYLHSSCSNIVECTFGVWKARWSISRDMPYYNIDTQRDILITTMTINNYIRNKCNVDNAFQTAEIEGYIPSVDFDVGTTSTASNIDGKNVSEESNVHWVWIRDMIANDICNS
ncbi:hypothetical protein P3S68_028312 [Capsicum galapagoense]